MNEQEKQEAMSASAQLRLKAIEASSNKDSMLSRSTAMERAIRVTAGSSSYSVKDVMDLTRFFYDFATQQEKP